MAGPEIDMTAADAPDLISGSSGHARRLPGQRNGSQRFRCVHSFERFVGGNACHALMWFKVLKVLKVLMFIA
jgi:hypothetical protein